jgi:hypothetical protein
MVDTQREIYVENKLEYAQIILFPEIQKKYEEITKDLALSNLDPFALKIAEMRQEIINIIILQNCIEWLPNSFESFMRDQHAMLQMHRSKFGFQSKLERSNLAGDVQGEKNFEKQKNGGIFNK